MHTERPLPVVVAGVLRSLKVRRGADLVHRKTGSRIHRTSGFISSKTMSLLNVLIFYLSRLS